MYIKLTTDQQKDIIEVLSAQRIEGIGKTPIKLLSYKSPLPSATGEYHITIEFQLPELDRDTFKLTVVGYVSPTSNTRRISDVVTLHRYDEGNFDSPSLILTGGPDYEADKLREYGIR